MQSSIFLRSNLKARLTLLIVLAVTPAFALYAFTAYTQMNTQKDAVRDASLKLVRVMKASHAKTIDDAKGVLKAMSQLSSLKEQGQRRCELLQVELSQKFPGFSQIGLAAPDGSVLCSTGQDNLVGNISSAPFFIDALARRDVGSGPYEINPVDGTARVFLGVPVTGADKRIESMMFASLSLAHFEALPTAAQLSRDSVIFVFDLSGLMLARYPDPQGWVGGRAIANTPAVSLIRASLADEGTFDASGADGVQRLFSYVKIHKTPRQAVFLATGIPTRAAYADAWAAFQTNMIILGIVLLLVIAIALAGSQQLVVRKMRKLIAVTNRIRKGDLGARSGVTADGDEVSQLAVAIDSMADSIQSRVLALQRHGSQMRELKELNDALQTCVTQDEVPGIVRQFAYRLFPEQAGRLYLMHASGDCMESKTSWGEPTASAEFLPEDCWAARRGKLYRVEAGSSKPRCHHVPEPPSNNYVCAPLIVKGELLGVLHLESAAADWQEADRSDDQPLAHAVAEHVALTLANLRLRETLHAQAMRDGLTGLFNRRFMEESLSREMRNAKRNRQPVSIIMIDIDHFKRFNDSFGHAAGDALLREVGNMLQTQMRGGDLACRYGGEEFTVILPATGVENAGEIAEMLRERAPRLQVAADGQPLSRITISLGVACFPHDGENWETVLHAADMALLQAKQTRNRVVVCGIENAPEPRRLIGA